ncbi:MAG TPA: archaeosortase/exosortase family protein [Parafilimonas sp.]|nr:archaeosortase/exosortase family protein [Parafilimonas sp.]
MKKAKFNIIYFLIIFCALYYGFIIYVGLITPGGKTFSPFLNSYLDIPDWLSMFVAKASTLLLKILGYDAYQRSAVNVTIRGGRGATIAWGCIGAGVMFLWFAFIFAHKAKPIYKLKWIIAGILLIFLFNILRISFIVLSYKYNWVYFQSFNAHATFNFITYIIIILLMGLFIFNYNKLQRKQNNTVGTF